MGELRDIRDCRSELLPGHTYKGYARRGYYGSWAGVEVDVFANYTTGAITWLQADSGCIAVETLEEALEGAWGASSNEICIEELDFFLRLIGSLLLIKVEDFQRQPITEEMYF